jgi:hypothetical protein
MIVAGFDEGWCLLECDPMLDCACGIPCQSLELTFAACFF